ncbi:hypothetical protein M8C21_030213 [Ambrosia artemisiifolia]|uniref:Uncharacterized protein n=1 Tax=Ambrosia artemisiifolia TaxID=4212 RepID=A0AAD5CH55_AMBAR|nr:hypothetical protein M8C21_030213 [Ambrosia artemisiifolia]
MDSQDQDMYFTNLLSGNSTVTLDDSPGNSIVSIADSPPLPLKRYVRFPATIF